MLLLIDTCFWNHCIELADEGIWVFEQSYMPTMLETRSFDTICQEHLEYYGLSQIKWMADRVGFRIIDVELNDINGGSFSVTAAKQNAQYAVSENRNRLFARRCGADPHTCGSTVGNAAEKIRCFFMVGAISCTYINS